MLHLRTSVRIATTAAGMAIAACAIAQQTSVPAVTATAETQPTSQGGANRAVVVVNPSNPAASRIVGTAELVGLEVYDLAGKRLSATAAGEAAGVDVRNGLSLTGRPGSILAAIDSTTNSLRFFSMAQGQLREVSARPVPLGFAAENVCLYQSVNDGALYAFAVGDGGEIDQHMLFVTPDGRVDARQVRRLNVPSTSEHCVADDKTGQLYVSEEVVGVWRFNADPETDAGPVVVDAPRLGKLSEEVGGVALYDGAPGARLLMASDSSSGRINVYDRDKDDAFVGAFTLAGPKGTAVGEPGGLYSTDNVAGLPGNGLLVVTDEDSAGGANYKVLQVSAIAEALRIPAGAPQASGPQTPQFPTIKPRFETVPVPSSGDASDDPAIWANRPDPAQSLIVGTDKKSGLHIYDMNGKIIQHVPDGKMNNVDLREGFRLGGRDVVLVTASDRTNKAIAIYTLDTTGKRLINVADGVQPSGLSDPYGQCMYRSPKSGKYYVFVSDPDGLVRQWELVATSAGKVRAKKVRDIRFGSQTEGCVVDDMAATLIVAEEDVGLWRIGAEPNSDRAPISIAKIEDNSKLKDDFEGVGLYDLGGGRGYLIVSSQGNNSYAVFRREGDRAYLGSFSVIADGAAGIDGISETDGLEVSSANLGPGFEHGALIAQDGRNVLPSDNQNFKAVSWDDIAAALNLEVRTAH